MEKMEIYSIGSTSFELCNKLTTKHSKSVHALLQLMIILNAIFLVAVAYTVKEMIKGKL